VSDPVVDFMEEMVRFQKASIEMHKTAARVRAALVDQMSELVEASGDIDLMAGWAARLAMAVEEGP
jgi:hypothetical protein